MNTTVLMPVPASLDGFADAVSSVEGVYVGDLEPLTTLLVRTRNTLYRLIVSRGTTVFVQGGRFFPEMTVGQLSGSSFGGSLLKLAWIGIGMRMEICSGGQRIVTSPVRSITTEADPPADYTQ